MYNVNYKTKQIKQRFKLQIQVSCEWHNHQAILIYSECHQSVPGDYHSALKKYAVITEYLEDDADENISEGRNSRQKSGICNLKYMIFHKHRT